MDVYFLDSLGDGDLRRRVFDRMKRMMDQNTTGLEVADIRKTTEDGKKMMVARRRLKVCGRFAPPNEMPPVHIRSNCFGLWVLGWIRDQALKMEDWAASASTLRG
jgi:hypothetical protein